MNKKDYEELIKKYNKLVVELGKQRCCICAHCIDGICTIFGKIPEDFLYSENECKNWADEIPF